MSSEFTDGVYKIRGERITTGVFKNGKFTGKPYMRFVYVIDEGPHAGLTVASTVPWVVSREGDQVSYWEPCRVSFKANVGMEISDFERQGRERGLDRRERMRVAMEGFHGVRFVAEVRRRVDSKDREWFDVWNLQERLGRPVADPQVAEVAELARALAWGREELAEFCLDEFGVGGWADLEASMRDMFVARLREVVRDRQVQSRPARSA